MGNNNNMKTQTSNFSTNETTQILDGDSPNESIMSGINPFEMDRPKISVSDAVNRLERESQELFKEKENVAKTTIVPEANNNRTAQVTDNTTTDDNKVAAREKLIMGMKPLNFALLAGAVVVVSYFGYKYYKKNKTLILLS